MIENFSTQFNPLYPYVKDLSLLTQTSCIKLQNSNKSIQAFEARVFRSEHLEETNGSNLNDIPDSKITLFCCHFVGNILSKIHFYEKMTTK